MQDRAKRVAEQTINQAESKAKEIVSRAEQRANDILVDARNRADDLTKGLKGGAERAKSEAMPAEKKKKSYMLSAGKSDTLVIHCTDPRFQEAFQKFLTEELQLKEYNPFIIPGASQILQFSDSIPKFSSGVMRSLKFIIKERSLKHIIIIMHEDCMWYHKFVPQFIELSRNGGNRGRQIQDMLAAKKLLQQEFPEINVRLFYADINPERKAAEFSEILEK